MNLKEFQRLSEKIPFNLKDEEREKRLTQLFDLKSLKKSLDLNLDVIDCTSSKLNLVKYNNRLIGIIFYEKNSNSISKMSHLAESNKENLDEIWLVYIDENTTPNIKDYIDSIEVNQLSKKFNKIFLLQSIQSISYQLQ